MDARARNAIVSAARKGKAVVNKVVQVLRYKKRSLVPETDEAMFVYDETNNEVARWLVNASTVQW